MLMLVELYLWKQHIHFVRPICAKCALDQIHELISFRAMPHNFIIIISASTYIYIKEEYYVWIKLKMGVKVKFSQLLLCLSFLFQFTYETCALILGQMNLSVLGVLMKHSP